MSRPIITIPVGTQGAQGPSGQDGNTILYGTTNPTTEGMNGDFYINTATNYLFGPKAGGVWPSGTSLIGPQGVQGTQGDPGTDGNTILYGTINPTTEGADGDFYINTATFYIFGPKAAGVWPAGTSLVGPSGTAADHELLTNLMGGDVGAHYHSDQPINMADEVHFKSLDLGCDSTSLPVAVEITECQYNGVGQISTSGSSTTITTTGGAFALAGLDSGSSITANGITVTVDDVIDSNTIDVFPAIDLTGGYSWTYKNPTRVAINRNANDKTAGGFSHYLDSNLLWESYTWPEEDGKFFYPAWSQRAYIDNIIIHENGKMAIGGKPYVLTGYKEPDASLEIYCHAFDSVQYYDGFVYTDNTAEAKTSNGDSFTILTNTSDYSYFGKYTNFSEIYFSLAAAASSSTIVCEYWNGSNWVSLSVDQDQTSNFTENGRLHWVLPSDWAMTSVNSSYDMYFVRIHATAISGTILGNCALPVGGGRVAIYRAPEDGAPVFSVDSEGNTAVGKAYADAQLDVVNSIRLSSSSSGYFHLQVPASGPDVSLITPTTAPSAGKRLGASSSSQLAWVDDSMNMYFGDGSDGDLTISSGTTTLAKDSFYNNLTISGTAQLVTSGYKLFVNGTLDLSNAPAGAINWSGVTGGASNGSGAGGQGTARTAQTLGGSLAGQLGAVGGTGAGLQGGASSNASPAQGGSSGASGKGGNNTSVPNAGGGARPAVACNLPMSVPYPRIDFLRGATLLVGGASGAGGSAGGGDGTNLGRGGGGGGSAGGIVVIYARNIITSDSTAAGAIAAKGGGGGAGGPTATGNVGGGGGGGAGGGGFVYLLYGTKTGNTVTGLIDVSGGTGGAGSNGAGTGIGGDGGNGGNGGRITVLSISAGAVVYNAITGTGGAGTAGSGVTGGTGGAGGVHTYTL